MESSWIVENLLLIGKQLNCGKFAVPHWCPDWNVAAKLWISSLHKKFHSFVICVRENDSRCRWAKLALWRRMAKRIRKQIFPWPFWSECVSRKSKNRENIFLFIYLLCYYLHCCTANQSNESGSYQYIFKLYSSNDMREISSRKPYLML